MSESLNNKTITINSNKLVQHKTKFKSIAVYNDEDYESNTVELINETYEGTSLSLKQESDPEDTNKLYITPNWSGTAPGDLSYIWKIIAADGYSEIESTDSNITFDEENTKLTINNKANINQFIVISVVAMSNSIFAAQSDPITIYGLGAAVTYNDWWNLLESEANEKNDGIYRLEDNYGNKIVGINADLIKTGALCVGEKPSIDQETGKVTDWGENILYAAIDGPVKSESDPIVGLAGWTVDKQSISKNGVFLYSGEEKTEKSLIASGNSPVRFGVSTFQEFVCSSDEDFSGGVATLRSEKTPWVGNKIIINSALTGVAYQGMNQMGQITEGQFLGWEIKEKVASYVKEGDQGFYEVKINIIVDTTQCDNIKNLSINIKVETFYKVLEDGSFYASAAEISGILTANAGSKIGGLTIGEDSIGISDNNHPNQIKTIIKESDIETRYIKSQQVGMGKSQNFVDIGAKIYDFSKLSGIGSSVYLSWYIPGEQQDNSTMFFITDSHFGCIDQVGGSEMDLGTLKAVRLKDLIDKVSAMQ